MNYGLLGVISNQIVSGGSVDPVPDYISYYKCDASSPLLDEKGRSNLISVGLYSNVLGYVDEANKINDTVLGNYFYSENPIPFNGYTVCFWVWRDNSNRS